ncbi:MAG TPA: ABC transporter permease subunit [Blastocatellia bacterium]|nr:ABC transporter permease subunit [Blastocatellia bacterium]
MRSRRFVKLLGKEWRELTASRAYWLLLLMIGPLVGQSFITAVDLYAEASGIGGGPAALPQGLTPLDGLLAPTFGAYDLAVTLLFPFIAIRLLAAEKESGALKLSLQLPVGVGSMLAAKGLVLVAGWILAWTPGLVALILWRSYGGHLDGPETLNLLLGHLLRMILSSGFAFAAAAIAESAASAAIVTLGFTVGTWALDFIAAGRGGLLQELAAYTPTAALRSFEQGLLRLSTASVMIALALGGFAVAAVWLHIGKPLRFRLLDLACVAATVAVIVIAAGSLRPSWDLSENRRNSFPASDEAALKRIDEPLLVTVFLSPEDPRLTDLERSILSKLRRVLPRVEVDYAATSMTGLFEEAEDHYGEVHYEMAGRKVMSRSTTVPIVLEEIYRLAGVSPPERAEAQEEDAFSGYPLAARPRGAAAIFYFTFPLATALAWWLIRKRSYR